MNFIFMLLGCVCLVVGIDLLILSFREAGVWWQASLGGLLVGLSYGIAWRNPFR